MKSTLRIALLALCLTACAAPQADTPKTPAQERLAKAEALFKERCQTAGEKIHRTADKVDGIFLMKLRLTSNYGKQYEMDDPYGHDSTGDEYFNSFLVGRNQKGSLSRREDAVQQGFRYIEALDPQDGKRYRYTGAVREVTRISSPLIGGDGKPFKTTAFVLDKTPATGPQPRYGVTYDDISTREDRDYWIAGSSLKVIDLKTSEVMAERIGYMMDRGQGNTAGARAPWSLAARNACPEFPIDGSRQSYQVGQTRNFVEKVLKPIQEK
jgi:hypothetical protein